MKKFAGQPRTPVETVVGTRALALEAGQRWYEGEGRGYTREFIPADETQVCDRCQDELELTAFPTFSVPRKDGRTRGNTCRPCVAERRAEDKAAKARSEKARKAAAARWAKANQDKAAA